MRDMRRRFNAQLHAGPVGLWPRPIPARVQPPEGDDLFVMTLGDVQTPLADAVFDPVADRLTLHDGTVIESYFRQRLGIPFYQPLDKTRFPLPPAGWCSWYYYYQEVSAAEVLHNARWLAAHLRDYGARFVQIDDGWQGVGRGAGDNRDWTTVAARFREPGMAGLAAEIRSLGLEAGLWLCPHGQSSEQVVRRSSGAFLLRPDGASASDTWEGRFLVDPSSQAGHAYLRDLFRTLCDWGYTYFKIDGQPIVLAEYARCAASMAGDRFPRDTDPAELYRRTLRTIRAAIGARRFLLGCWGVPLPGVGICDGARTAGDIVQGWDGLLIASDAVVEWNFLHNIAWYCDPDVCMVRPPLPDGVARAWATLQGLSGQALLTSDRLPDLPPARVDLLRRIYPALDIRPLDLFKPAHTRKPVWVLKVGPKAGRGAYDVVGVFNYNRESARTFHLPWSALGLDPQRAYHVFDFWGQTYLGAWEQGVFVEVPPADVRVLTLVPMERHPVLLSTSRHISQGWPDVLDFSTAGSDDAPTLKGRSRVIGGDPYTLTIGLPRATPAYRLAAATATGQRRKRVACRWTSHQGCATVTITSDVTQEVSWELSFAPAAPYRFPVAAPGHVQVTPVGVTEALAHWPAEYFPNAGYRVLLDDQPLGTALQTRALLRGLVPGRSYRVAVRSAWYDGSTSDGPAGGGADAVEYTHVPPDTLYLSDIVPHSATQRRGSLRPDRTVDGQRLRVGGIQFAKGLGTRSAARISYRLYGAYERFETRVGIDDEFKPPAPIELGFEVWGDGRKLWESGPVASGRPPVSAAVDIRGVDVLELRVLPPGPDVLDFDHADWLEARVVRRSGSSA